MNPRRSRQAGGLILVLALVLQARPVSAVSALSGDIDFRAEREGVTWVGQELELNLDLWTDGFSFGDQLFVLPEVKGAYLLQADSSTVKLNENRDGIPWQGLRYTFLLYPQRAGPLEVPAFHVSFSSRAAFDTPPAVFEFQTPPVRIEARYPPGADSSGLVVTSTDFSVEASWTPGLPGEGTAELKVGDAITLDVMRRARDVPGMVFAPLPVFSIDGLGVYPGSGGVNDRVNRGTLEGARSDSVTYVCEREGSFEIPQLRFQWWDPQREVLSEEIIPAQKLTVKANPAYADVAAPVQDTGKGISWKWIAAVFAAIVLLLFPGRWLIRVVAGRLEQVLDKRQSGEPWAFRQVRRACASGSATRAYNSITVWISRLEEGRAGLTLLQLANEGGNDDLVNEAAALQEFLVSGSNGEWNGARLARLLTTFRNSPGPLEPDNEALRPLNPAPLRSR